MKHANLLSMLQYGYKTVDVVYCNTHNKTAQEMIINTARERKQVYTFKVAFNCEPSDFLLVDTMNRLSTVLVLEVHDEPEIDPDADYTYKWAVCKIDFESYNKLAEQEKDFQKLLRQVEKERVRKKTRDDLKVLADELGLEHPLAKKLNSIVKKTEQLSLGEGLANKKASNKCQSDK